MRWESVEGQAGVLAILKKAITGLECVSLSSEKQIKLKRREEKEGWVRHNGEEVALTPRTLEFKAT